MPSIAQDSPVTIMTPILNLAPRLQRDMAFSRAAQLLADADRLRDGLPRLQLSALPVEEREFYKATSRSLIEVFETMTAGKEPDAVERAREAEAGERVRRYSKALMDRLAIERSTARSLATERGHDLGFWAATGHDGQESAACRRCVRIASIDIGGDPVLSGSALTEGCIKAADESADPRRA